MTALKRQPCLPNYEINIKIWLMKYTVHVHIMYCTCTRASVELEGIMLTQHTHKPHNYLPVNTLLHITIYIHVNVHVSMYTNVHKKKTFKRPNQTNKSYPDQNTSQTDLFTSMVVSSHPLLELFFPCFSFLLFLLRVLIILRLLIRLFTDTAGKELGKVIGTEAAGGGVNFGGIRYRVIDTYMY